MVDITERRPRAGVELHNAWVTRVTLLHSPYASPLHTLYGSIHSLEYLIHSNWLIRKPSGCRPNRGRSSFQFTTALAIAACRRTLSQCHGTNSGGWLLLTRGEMILAGAA